MDPRRAPMVREGTMTEDDLERRKAAYHEAGHAVLLAHFKVRISRVEIYEDCSGCCAHDRRFRRTPLVFSLVALAGSVAEQVWCGVSPSHWDPEDYTRACGLVGGDRDIPHLRGYTVILLKQYEARVHALAQYLMEHGAADTKAILGLFSDSDRISLSRIFSDYS